MTRAVQPPGWPNPQGYSNAICAQGEYVAIAGQIGWNEHGEIVSDDFAEQAAQALRNVAAVLHAAGGKPSDLVRMTWYVTDKHEYAAARSRIGEAYRGIIGGHYPAMTLVQVAALLEDRAKVEIEATAIIESRA